MWQIWLIIAGICFMIEIMTVGFLVFWFAIGSIFAMIVSFFTDNLIIQTTVFIVSSTILILATKPLVQKFLHQNDTLKTNVYSIVGKIGVVTKDIDSIQSVGQVKVEGEKWSAIGLNDSNIPQGTEVEIKEIKGVKAIVTPIQK
ncbi:MAG: NfeD family protein [Clostridia bacterium]|nr:NfeD family protein [Clostridia bacterium]